MPVRCVFSRIALAGCSRAAIAALLLGTALPALAQDGEAEEAPPPAAQPTAEAQGPIVPDDEFDKAIPPLDTDAKGGLESIDEWEAEQQRREDAAVRAAGEVPVRVRQSGEGQAPGQGDGSTAGGKEPADPASPAFMDGDASEELADPAPLDPALDEPLGAIADFDIEPVDESILGEDSEQQEEFAYRWRIDGLDTLEGTVTADAIRSRFKDHSALDDGDGNAANGAQVSARLRADRQLLTDVLSAAGYFDAVVEPSVELPPRGSGEAMMAILDVTPGPQYSFGTITFDAPPVEPADLISRNFKLKTGDPILADDVLAAEANIAVSLPRHGYPFVTVGQRDILLDEQARTGDYTLPVTPGPRSSFGDTITEGDGLFDEKHIYVLARFDKGDLYDSRKVDDLREALVATGLFSMVSVEPRNSGELAPDGTTYADLVVRQEAGPPRSIAGSAGYGTGQGFRVEGSWTHRNMFPPEGALILSAVLGTQEQGASATFRRSNAGKRDRSVELALSALHSNYDAYNAYTGRLAGRISYDSTPIWQKKLTYSYGFELVATSEKSYSLELGEKERKEYYIAALPAQVGFDTTNDLLDPVRGFRLNLKLSPEASLGDRTLIYGRGVIEGSAYYPFGDFVLAGRARVGSIMGAERADIAPSRRFYAGGGGSVRGFGYQELGPKDPNGDPIGGRSLVEGAVEARYRFGNYGVVAFLDAGQVYTDSIPGFDDIRFGAGIGGRFYTNFGPLRLDVAMPLGRREGESKFSVYVSIGQAF